MAVGAWRVGRGVGGGKTNGVQIQYQAQRQSGQDSSRDASPEQPSGAFEHSDELLECEAER